MSLDNDKMAEVVRPFASVADKIRALDRAGVARADIARFLGKRYQHVRNVLVDPAPAAARPGDAPAPRAPYTVGRVEFSGVEEEASPQLVDDSATAMFRLRFDQNGSVQIPPLVEQALGFYRGGVIIAELQGDRLILLSSKAATKRAQDMVRHLNTDGESWADSLIADRRREAAAEEGS
jgi:hypothetical protein